MHISNLKALKRSSMKRWIWPCLAHSLLLCWIGLLSCFRHPHGHTLGYVLQNVATQSVGHGPAALTSPGSLWATQNFEPLPSPAGTGAGVLKDTHTCTGVPTPIRVHRTHLREPCSTGKGFSLEPERTSWVYESKTVWSPAREYLACVVIVKMRKYTQITWHLMKTK